MQAQQKAIERSLKKLMVSSEPTIDRRTPKVTFNGSLDIEVDQHSSITE